MMRDDVRFHFVREPALLADRPSRFLAPAGYPRRVIAAVAALKPDVIHVQGLPHALATRRLQGALPGVPLLVQDHASVPPRAPRALVWRWHYRSLDGLAVTVRAQADAFVTARALSARVPVFEVIEGSTSFTPGDRDVARRATGLSGDPCFLWTGHLDANKDPITTLHAFRIAIEQLPEAHLWCCFMNAPLLGHVERVVAESPVLAGHVTMLGRRPHEELQHLFRASDFFVQMSHREGCSYSAIEALACGVTPLVTDIASNRRIVGDAGSLTPVGDATAMASAMVAWASHDRQELRCGARARFETALSYDVIGRDLLAAYQSLCGNP